MNASKELESILKNLSISDLIPHFIDYCNNHDYISNKAIAFSFLKAIDITITVHSEIYKKFKKRLAYQTNILFRRAKALGYLENHSNRTYKKIKEIKKAQFSSELLSDSLKNSVSEFIEQKPNATIQELRERFPNHNEETLRVYKSQHLKALGYLENDSKYVYKKIKDPNSLKSSVSEFIEQKPNATIQELRERFPNHNEETLRVYKSQCLKETSS